ncbi:MAG: DUF975 family protein [Lachnospiraceae bacterium]|nr:DUF975 family protein [Lachnospiraceae bacterium]
MNEHLSSASLKSQAKGQLLGKYGTLAGIVFIHLGYTVFVLISSNLLIDASSVVGYVMYFAVSIVFSLLEGLLIYGEAYIYLKLACNQPIAVSDLFYGFSNNPDKILKVQAAFTVVHLIGTLPNAVPVPASRPYFLLFYVIFTLSVSILYIVLNIMLSQSFFLMLDFPQYTAREVLTRSVRVMKGSKGRLFYIYLSFLPLILLGICSCCIPFIWLQPYMQAVKANFYLDLMKKKQ